MGKHMEVARPPVSFFGMKRGSSLLAAMAKLKALSRGANHEQLPE
jgi:hypothetical protein